jgi:hypothetical protein
LDTNPDDKRSLAANDVDEEESANQSAYQFDDSEDASSKQLFPLATDSSDAKEVGRVDSDRLGSTPLRQ